MSLLNFFIKDVETKEGHVQKQLKPHYYRADLKETKEVVLRYLNQKKYQVTNIDDYFGEIFVEERSFHMILSLKKISVLETAVYLKVSVYSLIGANKPFNIINDTYRYLDQHLRLKGIGLHS